MVVNGWRLLLHPFAVDQLRTLSAACARAQRTNPADFRTNANVKLRMGLAKLMLEVIPIDPGRSEYRQGNTLGEANRHWFRAKFLGRFRLFFRYDTRSRIIVYAWVNDERTLRQSGGRNDPYQVFRRMLVIGDPPNDWEALVRKSHAISPTTLPPLADAPEDLGGDS